MVCFIRVTHFTSSYAFSNNICILLFLNSNLEYMAPKALFPSNAEPLLQRRRCATAPTAIMGTNRIHSTPCRLRLADCCDFSFSIDRSDQAAKEFLSRSIKVDIGKCTIRKNASTTRHLRSRLPPQKKTFKKVKINAARAVINPAHLCSHSCSSCSSCATTGAINQ